MYFQHCFFLRRALMSGIILGIIRIPIFLLYNLLYPIYKHFYLAIILVFGVRGIVQQDWLIFSISIFTYVILSYLLVTNDCKKAFTQEIKIYLQKNGVISREKVEELNSKNFSINSDKLFASCLRSKNIYTKKNISHALEYLMKLEIDGEIYNITCNTSDYFLSAEKYAEFREKLILQAQDPLKNKLKKYLSQHCLILESQFYSILDKLYEQRSSSIDDIIMRDFEYMDCQKYIDENISGGYLARKYIIKDQRFTWDETAILSIPAVQAACESYTKQELILPAMLSEKLQIEVDKSLFTSIIKLFTKLCSTFPFTIIKNKKSENSVFAINNSKKGKYTCEQCNEIFTNLHAYESHHYCKGCLEKIKLAEKEGRSIKRKVDKKNIPPDLRKKVSEFENQKNISSIEKAESMPQSLENITPQPTKSVTAQNICNHNEQKAGLDYEEAAAWYRRAAEHGDANAQFNLGVCCANGQGVKQDYEEAVAWFHRAAEQGNAEAQYYLGRCYEYGTGVEQDHEEAVTWYRRAAEQRNADAQYYLGMCYEYGMGVEQDYEEAVTWYLRATEERAAEQGHEAAQLLKSHLRGIEYYYVEAAAWYRRAAEQGDANAQFNLGICYQNGIGIEQDYKKAITWYRRAAEQGHVDAQHILDAYYKNG